MAKQLDDEELQRIYEHVFLPPKLPQTDDVTGCRDRSLIRVTLDALEKLADKKNHAISNAVTAIKNLREINSLPDAAVSEMHLNQVLLGLINGQTAPVYVGSQNAAVLLSRQQDQLVVEAFELSPLSSRVLEAKGRLTRTFPGVAVSVDMLSHPRSALAPVIANTLSTMCADDVFGMQPEAFKSGEMHVEIRDTTSPAAVTELFIGFLKGLGSPIEVSAISKNTRDEVLWSKAKLPWRRSPMWLLIRVALQLVISRSRDGSTELFKKVMVFIMSQILESATERSFPSENLHGMSAKIVRRLHKLHVTHASDDGDHDQILTGIDTILHTTVTALSARWQTIQHESSQSLQLSSLATLDISQDALVSLPALDEYISSLRHRPSAHAEKAYTPSSSLVSLSAASLPVLPRFDDEAYHYTTANLQEFELWITDHLESWSTAQGKRASAACHELHELMQRYHTFACAHYAGCPEGVSVMILTMFELWVMCDRLAVAEYPMLAEYDPDISLDVLQNLLLPFPTQMGRLRKLETYFSDRAANSDIALAEEMFTIVSEDNFAARYFDSSELHQKLRSAIERKAESDRTIKTQEYQQMQVEYDKINSEYEAMDHEQKFEENGEHDGKRCRKCYLFRCRKRLEISVHEWPIPEDDIVAKVVVFELNVPAWYASWRDARLFLLHDVLRGKRERASLETKYVLSKDPHLQDRYTEGSMKKRIGLLSNTKPLVVTHYKPRKFRPSWHLDRTLDLDDVCVVNGLTYRYFDHASGAYVGFYRFDDTVARNCTYLSPTPELQRYIFRPASRPDGELPNTILGSQDVCPGTMSLDEYEELSSVPHGHHTQWINILQQLAMPGVDFKKIETTLVFLQCIYQAGPPGIDLYREAHTILRCNPKARDLILRLDDAVNRVKQNWESAQALGLFASIATRVLFLNHSTQDLCLPLLAKIREASFGWMRLLRDAAYKTTSHEQREMFIAKIVEVALICGSTYDTPLRYTKSILGPAQNVSMLVQATIAVQQGGSTELWRSSALQLMRLRFIRYLHRVLYKLVENLEGINDAISQTWSSYRPGPAGWTKASPLVGDWITTVTDGDPMLVHYSLLSGELLVNGVPLDQPPSEYRAQPLYQTLFGNAIVEVLPASSKGFRFSTKRSFGDHAVQIGLQSTLGESELIVQGAHPTGNIEHVPRRVFSRYFPSHFIDDYVHWYSFETGNIELRPSQDPWNPLSTASWTLQKTIGEQWRLYKDDNTVVGLQTKTSKAIANILQPLTTAHRTHCILQPIDKTLNVDIPALNLNFLLRQGDTYLRSKEFPSMTVDEDQSLGSLIGFSNKLMLKSEAGDRLMLLPEASVTYTSRDGHASVNIMAVDTISQVHAIHVDRRLGRLVDSGDIGCKLYLAYLHALTTFCLPDPLILMTGTEQALAILNSCAVRSFSQLSQENPQMLALIAELSPGRHYYPSNMKRMQTVKWNKKLGSLAQHARLRFSVQAILDQARDAMVFDPELKLSFPALSSCDEHLQQRDSIRISTFRVPEFGAEDHSVQHDKVYSSRDRRYNCQRADDASIMSAFMLRPGTDLHMVPMPIDHLWQRMCVISTIGGPEASAMSNNYRFDGTLTEDGNSDRLLAKLPLHLRTFEQKLTPSQRYSIAMWLSSLAFATDADMELLQMLAMICKAQGLSSSAAPTVDTFALAHGLDRSEDELTDIVDSCTRELEACPEFATQQLTNENKTIYEVRRKKLWKSAKSSAVTRVVAELVTQWMARSPAEPDVEGAAIYIDMEAMMEKVKPKIQAWHDNNVLYEYLDSTTDSLAALAISPVSPPALLSLTSVTNITFPGHFTVQDIFLVPAPQIKEPPEQPDLQVRAADEETNSASAESLNLFALIESLEMSAGSSSYEQSYANDLKNSLNALQAQDDACLPNTNLSLEALDVYLHACKDHVYEVYSQLLDAVSHLPQSHNERATLQFPRLSTPFFLQQLAHDRVEHLPHAWKTSILNYGLALTALQRAERLARMARDSQYVDLLSEYRNLGHQNWSPDDHPQSLLMEIESGIMIRDVQEQVAAQMRNPSNGGNAVMQLNMGEGKSTVIIPMVAATLADGHQLVRIIVAKPQSKQMAQMLIAKLGGLVKRRVYYLPFSRSLKLDQKAVAVMHRTLKDCMRSKGILLVQPEHILSFRLMAPECYLSSKDLVGRALMEIQDYFDKDSRDIVDESDENFSVRFELIYTMGTPQTIELSPDRWLLMQQVLGIVKHVAPSISERLSSLVETRYDKNGAFPRLRFLHVDATEAFILGVAAHIRDNGFEGFHVARQSQDMRDAIFEYMTQTEPNNEAVTFVEAGEFWAPYKSQILLLRGILAGGILAFALGQKRWRVNYGLASRTPPSKLAVPYRAKDNPTARSEFSHPDVVIVLTSLCYYYGGMTDEDMFTALGHLVDSDQSDAEYQTWVRNAPDLPVTFHQLQGINLKDRLQCVLQLFPHLRKVKVVVDYFLSHIVFPKETRQFPQKLSVSGWDIGKKKQRITTGFSGTNDTKRLLPLSVNHLDLQKQLHTNALVLEHLLQSTNGVELMASTGLEHQISDAERLLSTILRLDPPVQVILDVGAQILEFDNLGLAKEWLKLSDASKEAVVFVNDSDELCVVDRKGRPESLQTSPYASRLDSCLVFLDESHTRGIDLKLPPDYRAAVTLGAHLTKDRLVQACMRMRKLGQGQSVVFCVSREIQAKIHENMRSYSAKDDITVADVLLWSISETHAETRRSIPLWAVQGERFVQHARAWRIMQVHGVTCLSRANATKLLEDDAQSLEDRYRPSQRKSHSSHLAASGDPDLERIHHRCLEFDGLAFNSSTLQEEQERELSPEIEQERQRRKAPPGTAARHSLHKDVLNFAQSGEILSRTDAYMPAFESLALTSASNKIALGQLAGERKLLVSADFAKAVTPSGSFFQTDAFQRHVHWVLTRRTDGGDVVNCMMIVSEYEANLLLPSMKSSLMTLHKYKARTNAGYRPLDKLDLFTTSTNPTFPEIPRSLSVQLSLFAGQLYISSYKDYVEICRFLGLSAEVTTRFMERQGWRVAADGFILTDGRGRLGGTSGLTQTPTRFLKVLMCKIRKNGDGISKTHMGQLLDGKLFHKSEWEASNWIEEDPMEID